MSIIDDLSLSFPSSLYSQASEVDYIKVHQTLMPFYMWPSSHSDTVKTMLNIVEAEKKVKGQ